ncbi:MAG: PAC2 family protein [Frankiaceae bacterium]
MLDPRGLYELVDEPVGEPAAGSGPALVVSLSGFVDAGSVTRLAARHLLDALPARRVATFDVDQLLDYRSRRPAMLFAEDHWEHYQEPRLSVDALTDGGGTEFLLLSGLEPDLQWHRFVAAVRGLVERLGVRLTVGLGSIPMAVPHTRPVGVTAHATDRELIAGHEPWLQRVQVPGSAANLLEHDLGRAGHDALGFAVHVPHYLADNDYPAAVETVLGAVSRATGLLLPADALRAAAERMRQEVDEQVAGSEEVGAVVRALEQQYDAYVRGREGGGLLAGGTGPLPSAEELGAELERFLAEQAERGDGQAPGPGR